MVLQFLAGKDWTKTITMRCELSSAKCLGRIYWSNLAVARLEVLSIFTTKPAKVSRV